MTVPKIAEEQAHNALIFPTEQTLNQVQHFQTKNRQMSHKMNNIFSIIEGYSQLIFNESKTSALAQDYIVKIRAAINRGVSSASPQKITLNKSNETERFTHVSNVVDDIINTLKSQVPAITYDIDFSQTPDITLALTPSSFSQVISPILFNAAQAIGNDTHGTITISGAYNCPDFDALTAPSPDTDGYFCLTISDTGSGIAVDQIDHIFQPFFSTKDAQDHYGIGLPYSCYALNTINGAIACDTSNKNGATFHIFFPIQETEKIDQTSRISTTDSLPADHGLCVLVVDDEPDLVRLQKDYLTDLGFFVTTAGNYDDAIQCSQEDGFHIDLLFTDMNMPNGTGMDIANTLRQTHPDLHTIIMSGESAFDHHYISHHDNTYFLAKPVNHKTLMPLLIKIEHALSSVTDNLNE